MNNAVTNESEIGIGQVLLVWLTDTNPVNDPAIYGITARMTTIMLSVLDSRRAYGAALALALPALLEREGDATPVFVHDIIDAAHGIAAAANPSGVFKLQAARVDMFGCVLTDGLVAAGFEQPVPPGARGWDVFVERAQRFIEYLNQHLED